MMDSANNVPIDDSAVKPGNSDKKKRKVPKVGKKKDAPEVPIFLKVCFDQSRCCCCSYMEFSYPQPTYVSTPCTVCSVSASKFPFSNSNNLTLFNVVSTL